jgi:hypothetical protein
MKIFKNLFLVVMFITFVGCSMNKTCPKEKRLPVALPGGTSYGEDMGVYYASKAKDTAEVDAITGATKAEMNFVVLGGATYGGIVDNYEAKDIEGVSDVDAITGATKLSYNAGIHSVLKGHGRAIEIGLDYIKFNQSVEYDLPSLSVNGTRDFEFQQIRLPITYNFEFFENELNQPKLSLKLGFSVGYTFSKTIEDSEGSENMPDYEFTDWGIGPDIGLYFYPFDFKQNYRLGLYMDFYRGRKIYEDAYHDEIFLGDNSFLKFGVVFEP